MERFRQLNTGESKNSYFTKLILSLLIFQFLGIFLASLVNEEIASNTLYLSIAFVVVSLLVNILYPKFFNGDATMFYLVNLLYSTSLIMLIRLNSESINQHIIWYFAGIIIFALIRVSIKYINKILKNKFIFFFVITLLTFILTLIFGYRSGGAKNWISIGGRFSIQLSEFAKISYIFMIAAYYNNYEKYKTEKFGKYYLAIATYLFAGLFFIQGELGTAMVFFALMLASIFIFEGRYLFIFANIAVGLVGIYLASLVLAHIQVRIDIWLDPWKDFNGRGYQIIQSLFSIASGGFFGTGIGLGSPQLVPVVQTDFILAGIIEEMGLFMGFAIILIYILIFYKSIKVSLQFKSKYMSSLAMSIGLIYSVQTLLMYGGILKLIPLTGITTPFLSYGGSSTISNFILLGILHYLTSKSGEVYETVQE